MPTADRSETAPDETAIRDFLIRHVAERCRVRPQEVNPDRPLAEFGLASRDTVAIVGELEGLLDRSLSAILFYEYPTIGGLARELAGVNSHQTSPPAEADLSQIAVVGLGCRFPGGIEGPEAYWRFLLDRGDAVRELPAGRWEPFGDGFEQVNRFGGFLDDVAGFDSRFFGITPGEADAMDPQQRLLLEVAWEAFDHAAIAPASLHGSRTGVFVGISSPDYALLTAVTRPEVSPWTTTGTALSIAANRLSYLLDLRGPSMSVDTACSSSLVATHLAVQSLCRGESDLAMAGGINVLLSPTTTMTFDQAGGIAPDGRCKAFDASADGMVRAEGCGVVILKRLGDARRDGDRVLAIIQNTAVNSNGRSNGLVAPSPGAQEALLREAYAGLESVDYVETHGTGTLLGDPIEAHALGAALGPGRATPLLIGSAKTNLGHLEPAAGVAGLIKTVLALSHRTIPASLHYSRPNPHIDFVGLGLKVVAEQTLWPSSPGRAGVSSFGFGGTNAHVVLEEAPVPTRIAPRADPVHTLVLSDVSADRVTEYAGRLADDLGDPADVAHTLARRYGRGRFGAAVVGRDHDALTAGLRALHTGCPDPAVVTGVDIGTAAPVWVFSGYGAQRPGMARRLLSEEPAFAEAIELLEPLIMIEARFSVWEALNGDSAAYLRNPAETMIVLFAVQVGLARLWQAYGVEPAAVIGHSMGEAAAAVVAGALSTEDGVKVVVRRARLLRSIAGGGAMALLGASADETAELCAGCPDVHVAVRSAPRQTVITGDTDQVATVVGRAAERGLLARLVAADGAGHSPQVEPLLEPLRQELAGLRPAAPRVAFYSTVLDDPRRTPAFDADYWAANLRQTVRLVDAVRAAAEDGHRAFVEVSAHPLLAHALAETVEDSLVLSTLRRGPVADQETDDTVTFHTRLAALKLAGLPVRLPGSGRVTDVPGPSWQHVQHWTRTRLMPRTGHHPLLGAHVELPGKYRHAWSADVGQDSPSWLPVHGVTVLPTAAYAEIALAAGGKALGIADPAITGLRTQRFLPLEAHTTITTVCARDRGVREARVEVLAHTPAGTWTPLAEATVIAASTLPVMAQPYFAGRVEVPPAEPSDPRFTLHPVVLDRCLAAFGADWVAVGIGSLRVLGPTQGGGYCEFGVLRSEGGATVAGLRLVNEVGTILLEADDVVLRRVQATDVPVTLSAKLVEVAWNPTPLTSLSKTDRDLAGWLLLAGPGDADVGIVAEGLRTAGGRVVRCDHPDPTSDDLREILSQEPPGPVNVVVMVPPGLVEERLLLSMAGLIRELPPTNRLWIVTRRAIAVRDGEAGEPGQAFVRALTRVLGFEHPALRATLIDVDDASVLPADLLTDGADTEIAWRAGVRYAARLRPARLGEGSPREVVRAGGSYAISGGYGGLGLMTARWLAERGAGRVVLSGRSGPRPEAETIINELRAAGTEVEIVLGDIAAPGVAERLVAAARRDGLQLRGVVHAAGTLDDRLVTELGPEDLHRVWAPKVDGASRLHEATHELDLDWWVVYSSAAALLGSPGQAAYAAANARADALVDWRRAHGLPATTINWGPWAQVGGAAGLTVAALDPITPEEGVDAQEALLAHDRVATGVLRFNTLRALAAFPEIGERPYFAQLVDKATVEGAERADGDDWSGPQALHAAEPETARRLVSARVRQRISAVLGFAPDPERPMTEVGLDSLVAVRIKSALEHDFGVTVPAQLLLRGASVTALQVELCRLLGLAAKPSAERVAERHVVRLVTDGARHDLKRMPFFCAHAAGGDSSVYRQLATLLGGDQAFYGLERFQDAPDVEERAERYITAIRTTQPEGPYRLGGWSFGGVLAYEIARQLGSAEVELVAMIDGGLPRRVENVIETTARRYAEFGSYLTRTYGVPIALPFQELAALEEEQQLALVIERTKPVMAQLPPAVAVHQFTSHQDTRSLERYRPGPYDGRTVLYRSTEPTPWTVHDARYDLDEANGFADLCPHLEIVPVQGSHHLNLLDQPGVQIIADHLKGLLRSAARLTSPNQEPADA
jgi:phthiocerol/phenolphthiocerol synthesis type-I polyketide synthase D